MSGGFNLGWVARSALVIIAVAASGCASQTVEAAFASDFHCNSEITVEESAAPGRFNAHGCGREAVYQCLNVTSYQAVCDLQATTEPRGTPERIYAPPPRAKPTTGEVHVQNKKGKSTLSLELSVGKNALLRLNAAPESAGELVQLKLLRQWAQEDADECQLDFMINGQVLKMPPTLAKVEGKVISHRVQVGRDIITELSMAEKIAFRACDERFSLDREQTAKVRDFMDRYQEEMAWKGAPRDAGTAGMLAPSGGWPEWAASGTPATAAVAGTALEGTALFKKLSVSVFKLEATRAEGTAQGSAVAVSTTELVTNCHVVQGALKLVLKQDKQQWPATVVRADPKSDRCVLKADHPKLTPVAGVRTYDSLEVGEKVYTLGTPSGLELTLSDGIVSGRRDEGTLHLVQTTAPISPGSSGGGLFDARGNLVGVTTLVLTGRERLNQALNFAIPADSFWQK